MALRAASMAASAFAGRASRIEAGGKQLDEQADEVGVLGECRLDVGLAEREPDLAQVFGVCAQHRHLACVETGEQHETVEAVALDHAVDEAGERLLHVVAPRLVEHHLVGHAHSDVVEIHARAHLAKGRRQPHPQGPDAKLWGEDPVRPEARDELRGPKTWKRTQPRM